MGAIFFLREDRGNPWKTVGHQDRGDTRIVRKNIYFAARVMSLSKLLDFRGEHKSPIELVSFGAIVWPVVTRPQQSVSYNSDSRNSSKPRA